MASLVRKPAPQFASKAAFNGCFQEVKLADYRDKNGEVCPANWKPGSASMKPEAEGSKTYFRQAARK